MANNFTGAAEIIGPYIHSNAHLFVKNAESSGVLLGSSDIGGQFGSFLQNAKSVIVNEVKQQVDFLQNLETKLANSVIAKMSEAGKKVPFSERIGFLEYLNKTSNTIKNGDFSLQSLINVKEKMEIPRKQFNKLINELGKKIAQPLSAKEAAAIKKYNQNKKLNEEEQRRYQRALIKLDALEETKRNFKELKKETKKIIDKANIDLREHHELLADYYQSLLIYAASVVDGYVTKESIPKNNTKEVIDKKQMSAAKMLLDSAKFLGLKAPDKNSSAEDLQKFREEVMGLDSVTFLSIFYSNKAVDYMNKTTPAFQMDARLGDLFELALRDSFLQFIEKTPTASLIFDDLKLTGNLA
jgi:hypothetical protein